MPTSSHNGSDSASDSASDGASDNASHHAQHQRASVRSSVVDTRVGPVPLRRFGTGSTVVLAVHGALVDGRLWDGVATNLAADMTVLVPDLPLGAQRSPVPNRARLTVVDLADALIDVLDDQPVAKAILVGNDSGGALAQISAAHHPDRFSALVLTSCDTLDHFPPPLLRPLPLLSRVPGFTALLIRMFSRPRFASRPGRLNLLTAQPVDEGLVTSMLQPALRNAEIRADLGAFVRGMDPVHTRDAARRLAEWSAPIVLAWSRNDRIFPPRDAQRLAALLPTATLQWIDNALTFSPLDRPDAVAHAIRTAVELVATAPVCIPLRRCRIRHHRRVVRLGLALFLKPRDQRRA